MPNRIIKESICESEGLSECSIFARDLYSRLITYADDYGRFNADTQIMLARLYPREMDCTTQEDINDALVELSGVGKIAFYTSTPRKSVYGCFPNWKAHQRVRDSKQKCPDPDDTTVNDWYLQRFIPMDLKVEIIERDGFKCHLCGKFITSDRDARRLAKHGCGMYHIDHIVPVSQGGRATLENLRLTCPICNLKRKKRYSFKDIVNFSIGGNSPQLAETCGKFLPESNPNPNPIQSESKRECAGEPHRFSPPSVDEVRSYCLEHSYHVDAEAFVVFYESKGWMIGKNKMKDWKKAVLTWEKRWKEEHGGRQCNDRGPETAKFGGIGTDL